MGFKAGVPGRKMHRQDLKETVKSSLRWPGTMAKYCGFALCASPERKLIWGQPCPGVRPEAADTRGSRPIAEYTAVRLRYILSRTACSLPNCPEPCQGDALGVGKTHLAIALRYRSGSAASRPASSLRPTLVLQLGRGPA